MKNNSKTKHADIWIDATWISVFKTGQSTSAKFPNTPGMLPKVSARYTAQGYTVRVL